MSEKVIFFTDEHIPGAIVREARKKGIQVIRCQDEGLMSADDTVLLAHAAQAGYLLVTGDRDFERLHYAWLMEGRQHHGIVFVPRRLRWRIGLILEYLELISDAGKPEEVYNTFWRVE